MGVIALLVGLASGFTIVQSRDPGQAQLAAVADQARKHDYYRLLMTLNDIVADLESKPDQAPVLARAYAYRALAYLNLDQPERATAAALQAIRTDPKLIVAPGEFGSAVAALFDRVRRPATNPEAAGDAAARGGWMQEAFLSYVAAYQQLSDPPPSTDDRRLREKVIRTAVALTTPPEVPADATARVQHADDLLEADALLGGGSSAAAAQAAEKELRQALRIAPWWGDATLKLARALQKQQRVDEALANLNLYKLADPGGYASALAPPNPEAPSPAIDAGTSNAPATFVMYWLHMTAFGIKPTVVCDGKKLADLENGHWFAVKAAPGQHTIAFRDQNISGFFEAGSKQYIRVSKCCYPAHLVLSFVAPDSAESEIRDGKIVENDPRRTLSADCSGGASTPAKR